jgi:3-oxoacyl-[acyl-carrier-protein] synthase II
MGLVSPLGNEIDQLWENLLAGKSGIAPLDLTPTASLPYNSGGECKEFTGKIECYGPMEKKLQRSIKKNMKVMCREIEMGVAVSQKALTHCNLPEERDATRCGCHFGCDYILTRPEEYVDGVRACREVTSPYDDRDWPEHGLSRVEPLWLLKYLPNMPNSHVSIYNDFRGPNNSITMREASMNLAIAEATSIIQRGAADLMVVGSTGSRLHPLRTSHVTMIENLASQRDDAGEMARPYDATCDGMVLGEGAGALVLESLEHATARGATIWAEVLGSGSTMVGPTQEDYIGQAVEGALKAAISAAGERLPAKWHLHAHGLSNPEFDAGESRAIGKVVSNYQDIPVTAAKSYFGNLGAGATAIELIASIVAMKHKKLFPIRNLNSPASHVTWTPATLDSDPGDAVVHSSYTQQGQASSLVLAAAT